MIWRGELLSRRAVWLAAALSLTLAGCARWDLRGDGFGDNDLKWDENSRSDGKVGESTAVTRKGAEIERDLGVR